MKKIFLPLFIFFILSVFAADDINTFINKAKKTAKQIDNVQKKYDRVNEIYQNILKKIENVKAELHRTSGIIKNFESILLNYYLFRGNKAAYNISVLRNKLKELKDDYFTYIVLIIDGYNSKIKNCISEKCSIDLLEKIYFERKEWVELIKNYEELLSIEELVPVVYVSVNKEVQGDIKNYYEKKLIQINQIIFILNEEKDIRKTIVKYGIRSEQEKISEILDKIKILNNKKMEIEKFLKI